MKIAAITGMGSNYPPYINVQENDGAPGTVRVTLRGDRSIMGECGMSVVATFTSDEWRKFKEDLL